MNYIDAAFAPLRKTGQIKLYGPEAFAGMRKAGQLVAECLDQLCDIVKPGLPSEVIDKFVFDFALAHGARPATLMYRGYNKSTCTSINHVVCHGIPNEKPLKEGDIVNIDVTLILDGWHGDSSRMYPVGDIPRKAERLIEVTYEAMMRGIAAAKPGRTHRAAEAGPPPRGHRRRDPELRRAAAHERGSRLLRPRARPPVPRRAEH